MCGSFQLQTKKGAVFEDTPFLVSFFQIIGTDFSDACEQVQ